MKYKLYLLTLLLLLNTFGFLFAQQYCYEDDFSVDPLNWTFNDEHWSIYNGKLWYYWAPYTENFSSTAISPQINLPANVGDLTLNHYLQDFVEDTGEVAKIIVIHNNQEDVIWEWNTTLHNSWGSPEGNEMALSLSDYANQTIQLKFQMVGTNSYNVDWWNIFSLKIEGSFSNDLKITGLTGNHTPAILQNTIYHVQVKNNGSVAQSGYTVQLVTTEQEVLGTVPGPTLSPNQSTTVNIDWVPLDIETVTVKAQIVSNSDQQPVNNTSLPFEIITQEPGIASFNVGNGNDINMIFPFDMFFNNSIGETIYMASEINASGQMSGIVYFNRFIQNATSQHIKIWVKETEQTDLASGWINPTEMTLVFDGNVDFPKGEHVIYIPFQNSFFYSGAQNLAVFTNRAFNNNEYDSENKWYYSQDPNNPFRSRYYFHDMDIINPFNPPNSDYCNWYPNITFLLENQSYASIQGNVQTILNNQPVPLANAMVKITELNRFALTDESGAYEIPSVQPGNYHLVCSKTGFYDSEPLSIVLAIDQTLVSSFQLSPLPVYTVSGTALSNDTNLPLAGVSIQSSGYSETQVLTNPDGTFSISLFGNHAYDLTFTRAGYDNLIQPVNPLTQNLALGNVVIYETTVSPSAVTADTTGFNNQTVRISWVMNTASQTKQHNQKLRNRSLLGYDVYRLANGAENQPEQWIRLNQNYLNDLSYLDHSWATCSYGIYKYAVIAYYSNGRQSAPAFSQTVNKNMTVNFTINLTTEDNVPIQNAFIKLSNIDNDPLHTYTGTFNTNTVVFPEVWRGNYNITVKMPGYHLYSLNSQDISQTANINVNLIQYPLPVTHVRAEINTAQQALVTWNQPFADYPGLFESFENDSIPSGWTIINTNTEFIGPFGYAPRWEKYGLLDYCNPPLEPYDGQYQMAVFPSTLPQDEWLISPAMTCPQGISFRTVIYYRTQSVSHYYLKISNDDGQTWQVLWDASDQEQPGWNLYNIPVEIDLTAYYGQTVKLAWNAHSSDYHGLDNPWIIDMVNTMPVIRNTQIQNTGTQIKKLIPVSNFTALPTTKMIFDPSQILPTQFSTRLSRNDRSAQSFSIYRFLDGQAENQWTMLNSVDFPDTNYLDPDWANLADGSYRYAVKAHYTGNRVSQPSVSPVISKNLTANVIFNLSTNSGDSPDGAILKFVSADGQHTYQTTCLNNQANFTNISKTTYTLTIKKNKFNDYTNENLIVNQDLTQNVQLIEKLASAVNLQATVDYQLANVQLNWLEPQYGVQKWVGWCDTLINDAVGCGQAEYDAAIRFEPEDISEQDNLWLTKISFAPFEFNCEYTLRVWQGGNANNGFNSGTLIYEQLITQFSVGEWNTFDLDIPIQIDASQELWIGYHMNSQTGWPIGCDHTTVIDGKGNLVYWEDQWNALTTLAPNLPWNFAIRGYAAYEPGRSLVRDIPLTRKKINPPSDRALLNYRVTRDDLEIYSGNETSCQDLNVPVNPSTHIYKVYAVYTTGSAIPAELEVSLLGNSPSTAPECINQLKQNYPNPFNPDTKISYSLQANSQVCLEIFNVKGQKVKTLVNGHKLKGHYNVVWNGKDEQNKSVSSGIYYCRMTCNSFSQTKKMLLIK